MFHPIEIFVVASKRKSEAHYAESNTDERSVCFELKPTSFKYTGISIHSHKQISQFTTMGAAYNILGKTVPPHQLALGTIGAVVLLVLPKPWATTPKKEAKIDAANADEEKFIKAYLEKHA